MKTNRFGRLYASRAAVFFCAAFIAALAVQPACASCVTAAAGSTWDNSSLSGTQTHTFTAYYDVTPSAAPVNAFVGLSNGAQTAFTGFATLTRFNPTGQIDARNGGTFSAASPIPYFAGNTYHFRVAVNVAARTYSIYVTPPGGSELTVGINYAFRTEQDKVTQLDHWGVHADPSNAGSLTVCNFSIGVPTVPVFSPASGSYTGAQSVTITSAGATAIYYTTDGTTPTTASTLYVRAVSLPLGTTTLSAIAVNANGSSAVTAATYVLTPPPPLTPIFSPAGGTFTSAQSVTITSAGATAIYYTTDGTAPTSTSTLYTAPLTIANNTVLQAIGVNSSGSGPVGTASFTILPPAPAFSQAPGTYANVTTFSVAINDAGSATIYYTTDGSTPTAGSTPYTVPVSLPLGTTTLSAIAVNANGSSAVTAGTYILTPPPPLTPIFSPAGGTFTSAQSVTITSAGATAIYYTTDGTAPTGTSTLYTAPLTIANNTVLQAIGVNSGGSGPVGTASFTILPPAPAFSPAPGTYANVTPFSVTISDAAGATIYYTTDGSTPTAGSTPYTVPVSLPIGTTTLSAVAINANGSSAVTAGTYILTPPPPLAPIFSPAGGTFTSAQSVTITSAGATAIYYTTDGTAPATSSTLYTAPLTIANNTVLQAIGVNSGGSSPVGTASFTILPPAPAFSPAPGTYANVTTFSVTISDAGSATIYYTTDGSTPTGGSTPYTVPVLLPIGTTTLSAVAINANGSSAVTAGTYILTPPPPLAPIFSPAGGTFTSAQSVTITSPGATAIYYTTDGTAPTGTSTLYTAPVTIANNTVLQAVGVNSGGSSSVASASFTFLQPAAAPTFTPPGGIYSSAQTVTIADGITGPGAPQIRYTIDGSTPTEINGTLYSGAVNISATATLQAIAYGTGFTDSPVTSATYTISTGGTFNFEAANMSPVGTGATVSTSSDPNVTGGLLEFLNSTAAGQSMTLTTPSMPAGTYQVQFRYKTNTTRGQHTVTIDGTQIGGTIDQYATTATYPTVTLGNVTFATTGTHTIVLTVTGKDSAAAKFYITADKFTFISQGGVQQAVAPVFSPGGGTYTSALTVTITSSSGSASINYTTDGSTPTETNGTLYSGPVSIGSTTVLQAIAYGPDFTDSPVASATYTITQPLAPVFSPPGGTFTSAQSVSITSAGATAIYYTTDGSIPTTSSTHYTAPVSIANTAVLEALGANSVGTSSVAIASYTILHPDFSLSATSVSPTVLLGESTSCTITSIPVNGFNGIVSLNVTGLPSGVTGTFSPATITGAGNSTLTISASVSAPTGTYPLTVTGTCISQHSIPVTLNVSTNSSLQQAIAAVSQMSLAEEISQVHGSEDSFSIRYIPASAHAPQYNFTNGPAGIGNGGPGHEGNATAMPAPIALAATFDVNMAQLYGSIVGQEAVEYSNDMIEGPDINIARVPQNGRNFEAYGEDPYLVGQIAVNDIEGIQAQGISAESKHFSGNNQETNRMSINDIIDERTLREIYLPAFEATVIQGHVDAVMGAYNQVNGSFSCQNMTLLHDILKGEWGFTGYTTSDFGATQSTIASALAGLDAEMPTAVYYGSALQTAVTANQVPKPVLDEMLIRRFSTMINRGVFHAPLPNTPIPKAADGAVAREVAEAGMVLLQNNGGALPLQVSQLQSIALIGSFATSAMTGGGGSSHVTPLYTVSPLAGIQTRVAGSGITVQLNDGSNIASAVALAQSSTIAIVMVGDSEKEGVDDSISLSGNGYPNQDALVEAVAAANPHTVVVLKTGTAVLMPWVNQVPAILEAWYPGEEDGNAVAAVLFGDVNPSGKLPLTFPVNVSDCPANTPAQYPGVNGTATYSEGIFVGYRHYDASNITPLFPFGHGLSYTTFQYQNLVINPATTSFVGNPGQTVNVDLDIANTGPVAGSEVAQIYVGKPALPNGLLDAPQWLKGFEKISIAPGQTGHVHVLLNLRSFAYWDVTSHAWLVAPGNYSIYVGSSSRDIRLVGQVTIN